MAKPRLQAVLFAPPNRIGPTNVPALSWQGSRRPHHARPISRAPHHVTRPEFTPADDQHHFAVLGDDWWATETAWRCAAVGPCSPRKHGRRLVAASPARCFNRHAPGIDPCPQDPADDNLREAPASKPSSRMPSGSRTRTSCSPPFGSSRAPPGAATTCSKSGRSTTATPTTSPCPPSLASTPASRTSSGTWTWMRPRACTSSPGRTRRTSSLRPSDLLASAGKLVPSGRGRPLESDLRRAVSTAYYALFHGLAECCANELVGRNMRGQAAWVRTYRALNHGRAQAGARLAARRLTVHGRASDHAW